MECWADALVVLFLLFLSLILVKTIIIFIFISVWHGYNSSSNPKCFCVLLSKFFCGFMTAIYITSSISFSHQWFPECHYLSCLYRAAKNRFHIFPPCTNVTDAVYIIYDYTIYDKSSRYMHSCYLSICTTLPVVRGKLISTFQGILLTINRQGRSHSCILWNVWGLSPRYQLALFH